MYITAQGCRLRNDLYCVEWDVKLYNTIPLYHVCVLIISPWIGEKIVKIGQQKPKLSQK